MKIFVFFVFCLAICQGAESDSDSYPEQVYLKTGPGELYTRQQDVFVGYIPVRENSTSSLYYQLFAAYGSDINGDLSVKAPLIIWYQGGPGCASSLGLYEEMGPYSIEESSDNDFSFLERYGSWNENYHMMFVDQPIGVGFSPANDGQNCTSTEEAAVDMGVFYSNFYKLYSNYSLNTYPTYISGESYSGHYVPAFLKQIVSQPDPEYPINLQGGTLGNGLVDMFYQATAYAEYAFSVGVLDINGYNQVYSLGTQLQQAIIEGDNFYSNTLAEEIIDAIVGPAGNIDILNFMDYTSYHDSYLEEQQGFFLDHAMNTWDAVREYLYAPKDLVFEECSEEVYDWFVDDIVVSFVPEFNYLLDEDVELLLYSGQNDMNCNTFGTDTWMTSIDWNELPEFQNAEMTRWNATNGTIAGLYRKYENLAYALVFDAGHLVPMDQLNNSHTLIDSFINGQL